MPALATERDLVELASRLHLWEEQHMSRGEHRAVGASGQMVSQVDFTDRIVRFGDGPPEEALSAQPQGSRRGNAGRRDERVHDGAPGTGRRARAPS